MKRKKYTVISALETSKLTLGYLFSKLDFSGHSNFVPEFSERFKSIIKSVDEACIASDNVAEKILLKDINIKVS